MGLIKNIYDLTKASGTCLREAAHTKKKAHQLEDNENTIELFKVFYSSTDTEHTWFPRNLKALREAPTIHRRKPILPSLSASTQHRYTYTQCMPGVYE